MPPISGSEEARLRREARSAIAHGADPAGEGAVQEDDRPEALTGLKVSGC